jgi:hypothetical protein
MSLPHNFRDESAAMTLRRQLCDGNFAAMNLLR